MDEMMMETGYFEPTGPLIYKINDGRLWNTETAEWITEDQVPAGCYPTELYSNGKPAGEDYLIECLDFYKFPYGVLLDKSVVGLKRALDELDAKYLTPRTMAGLSVNDELAKQMWEEHERLAAPLRTKLATLNPAGSGPEAKAALLSVK